MKLSKTHRSILTTLSQDSSCRLVVRRGSVTIEGFKFEAEKVSRRTFESLCHHDLIYRQSFDKASVTEIYVISTIGIEAIEPKITFAEAKKFIRACGCTVTKKDGELRVNFRGGSEDTAYYTDDLQDAMDTAAAMENSIVNGADE